jgi:hypothetical protein
LVAAESVGETSVELAGTLVVAESVGATLVEFEGTSVAAESVGATSVGAASFGAASVGAASAGAATFEEEFGLLPVCAEELSVAGAAGAAGGGGVLSSAKAAIGNTSDNTRDKNTTNDKTENFLCTYINISPFY